MASLEDGFGLASQVCSKSGGFSLLPLIAFNSNFYLRNHGYSMLL